jgi:hypothetical protein
MVVVETTWLLRNLRKLRIETRTVNKWSGSGFWLGPSSSSCDWEGAVTSEKKMSWLSIRKDIGEINDLPILGLVQLVHWVSTVTLSVLMHSCSRPLFEARIARTSDIGRNLSTIVRSFWSGGRRMWTWKRAAAEEVVLLNKKINSRQVQDITVPLV